MVTFYPKKFSYDLEISSFASILFVFEPLTILLPSKTPFDSITSSAEEISPFTCPAALISTRSALILPSI